MKKILIVLLILSCIDLSQFAKAATELPNLKLGLSYHQMNLAIDYIVEPLLNKTLSNFTIKDPNTTLQLDKLGVKVFINIIIQLIFLRCGLLLLISLPVNLVKIGILQIFIVS